MLTTISLACAAICAQSTHVVPTGFGHGPAAGRGTLSVSSEASVRFLTLYDAGRVGFARGHITHLAFRQDDRAQATQPIARDLEIKLGYSDHRPLQLPTVFAQVPNAPLTSLFAARVSLPAAIPATPQPWIPLALTQPFPFDAANGNFVVDAVSTRPGGTLCPRGCGWSIDAHADDPNGDYELLGFGCNLGGLGTIVTSTRGALRPGGALALELRGAFGAVGAEIFGSSRTAGLPLDLSPFGAPGCSLSTDVRVVVPIVFDEWCSLGHPPNVGCKNVRWPIPAHASLNRLELSQQHYQLDPSANALGVRMGTGLRFELGLHVPAPAVVDTLFARGSNLDVGQRVGGAGISVGPIWRITAR